MNGRVAYRVCAALMLAAIAGQRLTVLHRPAEVAAYHRHIREVAASSSPRQVRGWIGEDVPVPGQAMVVLDPNVIISRRYVNVESGLAAGFLLVHCADAHDMAGHFPMRCYPADGWERRGSRERDWQVGDLTVTGMEYQFYRRGNIDQTGSDHTIVVANFLLRPGKVLRDMHAMTSSVVGAGGQSLGAGQVQVYFDSSVPSDARDQAIVTLLQGHRPIIDAMLEVPAPEQQQKQ